MRTFIATSILALALLTPGCKEPDPNRFETHVARIEDPAKRAQGFEGLERLTKTVITAQDNEDLLDEFATKVIPVFEKIWDDATEQRENMLLLLRDVGRPEGANLWSRAIELDGSSDARKKTVLALEGVKKAKATDAAPAIIEELEKLLADPKLDQADGEEGRLRSLMAETLGVLGDPKAVPVLIKTLEQPPEKQPVIVHRTAAEALGQIGDPAAVDSLLAVSFRVPDAATTTNIGEKVKTALAAIGAPATSKVLAMLAGEHEGIQKLAGENQIPQVLIQQTAVSFLGAIGDEAAVEPLVGLVPTEDCGGDSSKRRRKKAAAEEEGEDADAAATLRAFVANALGLIGDPRGAEVLCGCIGATKNPVDTFPILEALGRMGGDKAVACLVDAVRTAEYSSDAVEREFIHQPRWEAARFAILAAKPEDASAIQAAIASNKAPADQEALGQWKPGLELMEQCKEDAACYRKTLDDVNAPWFAREKAAFEVRRSSEGDVEAAEAVAKAFKVRSPDARVTMAWIPMVMLDDKACPKCVESYQSVLDAEKMSMDKAYQASVLMARYAMAKLAK